MAVGRRFLVEGMVQGVGYRAFVRRWARELGIAGSATNRPDGSVEILAVGTDASLERLASALGRGPSFGRVDRVSVLDAGVEVGELTGFEIR